MCLPLVSLVSLQLSLLPTFYQAAMQIHPVSSLQSLAITTFSMAVRRPISSKKDATTGSFCTCLLGELDWEGERPRAQKTSAAYIGLGEVCLHLIGYAFSTSFTCLRPGHDSAQTLMHMRTLVVYPYSWASAC